jgi:hypothetical protein
MLTKLGAPHKSMKQQWFWRTAAIILLGALPIFSGCLRNGPTEQTAITAAEAEPALAAEPVGDEGRRAAEDGEVSDAAIKRVSADKQLPAKIQANPALSEVIQLADSGVHETVLLAYVANSTTAFALGPDEIIFLNDVGVPAAVVAAMIEHDTLLKQRAADVAESQPPPPVTNPVDTVVASAPTYSVLPNWNETPEPPETMPVNYTEDYSAPEGDPSSVFYDSLAPYGTWVDVDGYGRCWQPSVVVANASWQPYCDRGHWVYTDCGWYWLSDYSWGWAPFHYGRWFQHGRLGWCWAPDRVWGPSWVSWRYSDDYCGWAPLPPRACYTSAGLTYNGRLVAVNFDFNLRPDCYTFVRYDRLHDRRLSSHKLAGDHVNRIMNKTVVATKIIGGRHTVSNDGLSPDKVAAVTHRPVQRATIREVNGSPERSVPERLDPSGQTVTVLKPSWRPPMRSLAHTADPATDPRSVSAGTPATTLWDRPKSPARPATYAAAARTAANESAIVTPTAPPMPRRPVRTTEAQPIPIAQPVEVAAETQPSWQRPRAVPAVPETSLAGPLQARATPRALVIRRQSDVDNPQVAPQPTAEWHWQPGPSASQSALEARAAARTWQTPSDSPRMASTPSHQAPAAPAQAARSATWWATPNVESTPRWDRPRQEASVPREPVASAPAPRDSSWQTPAHSAPAESPRSAPQTHSAPPAHSAGPSASQAHSAPRESTSNSSRQDNDSNSRSQSSSDNGSRGGRR